MWNPDFLILTRYYKFSKGDHSDCLAFVDLFSLVDLKEDKLSPATVKIQNAGPLFEAIDASRTQLILLYTDQENIHGYIEALRFWN